MLSVKKLGNANDAATYYTKTATDYYLKGDVELMAEFHGSATEENQFNSEIFEKVLHGNMDGVSSKSNDEVTQLGRPNGQGGIEHAPGWDLTFSAPKSISMMALIEGDTRLIDAHNKAVKSALNYLEQNGMYTRKTENNETKMVKTNNMFASIFTHTTSRALDPQLHSHAVIANATLDNNGKWCSIESKPLFDAKMTAGLIFRSELAHDVKNLGYDIRITDDHHKFFELKEVSETETSLFSKRSQQIKASADERGLTSQKQLDLAAIMTRERKRNVSSSELDSIWKDECNQANINLSEKVAPIGFNPQNTDVTQTIDDDVRIAYRSLATQEAAFSGNKIIEKVIKTGFGDYSPEEIAPVIDKFKNNGELLIHRNGFTTPKALAVETKIIKTALNMQGMYPPIASKDKVESWIDNHNSTQISEGKFSYTAGQSDSISKILTTTDGIININGWAGVGKTTMVNGVKDFTSDTDIVLRGIAPTGSASETLFQETGIESKTTDSFLYLHEATPDKPAHNEIWLVDESSLMNAENTLKLFETAERKGARVVNLGDTKQLGSVEWGKTFSQLQAVGVDTAHMQDVLRQQGNKDYLDAVICAANGDIKGAFSHVEDSFQASASPVQSLINEYKSLSVDDRENSIFVIPDNESRVNFMSSVREILQTGSHHDNNGVPQIKPSLSTTEISSKILSNSNLDRVELTDARFYKKGLVVEFQHDNETIGFKKGDLFTVQEDGKRNGSVSLKSINSEREINWHPSEAAKVDNSKFALSVYREEKRKFAVGDKVKWTKSNKAMGLLNGDIGRVKELDIKTGISKVEFEKGSTIEIDLSKRQTIDWAYSDTVFSSQGKTFNKVFGVLESWRKNLVHEKSFYVALSRGKEQVKFFVDSVSELKKALEKRDGEKTSALFSQDKLDTVKNAVLSNKTNYQGEISKNAKAAIEHSSEILSENKGIFSHSDLIAHSLKYGFGKLTAKSLEVEINKSLKTKELSVLAVGKKQHSEKFYSTGSHLKQEASLATTAKQGISARTPLVSKSYGNAFINSRNERAKQIGDVKPVSELQAKSINKILSSKHESVILNAKDSADAHGLMFGVVKTALKPRGVEIRALTVRSDSKEHLKSIGANKVNNAASFIDFISEKINNDQKFSFRKELWFVDDASLLSIPDTKKLIDLARVTGARIVFSEDVNEQPIKGAKAMDVLKSQSIPTIDITEKNNSDAISKANYEARTGAIDKAIEHITDKIIEIPNTHTNGEGAAFRLNSIVNAYLDHSEEERKSTQVVITDKYTRDQFTEIVRAKLAETGHLGKEDAKAVSLENTFMSPGEIKSARYYENGMVVRFDKDRDNFKANQNYVVEHTDAKRNIITLSDGENKIKWSPTSATFSDRYSQQVLKPKSLTLSSNDTVRMTETKYDTNNKKFTYKKGELANVHSIIDNKVNLTLKSGETLTMSLDKAIPIEHGYSSSHFSLKHSQSADRVLALMDSKKPFSVDPKAFINLLTNSKKNLSIITDDKKSTKSAIKAQQIKPTSALMAKSVKVQNNSQEHKKNYGLFMPANEKRMDTLQQKVHAAINKVDQARQALRTPQSHKEIQK